MSFKCADIQYCLNAVSAFPLRRSPPNDRAVRSSQISALSREQEKTAVGIVLVICFVNDTDNGLIRSLPVFYKFVMSHKKPVCKL